MIINLKKMNKNSYNNNLNLKIKLIINNIKFMKMVINMKDKLILIKDMVKEYLYNKMYINILETIITMKKMEMDIYI